MGKYLKIKNADFSANCIEQITLIIEPPIITFDSNNVVTIKTTEYGGIIYYTTDGSTPTTLSNVYTLPFVVDTNTTVKAIVVVGASSSEVSYKIISSWTPVDLTTMKIKYGIISNSPYAYPNYETTGLSQYLLESAITDLIQSPFRIAVKPGFTIRYLFYVNANTLKLTESLNSPGQNYDDLGSDSEILTINPLPAGIFHQITIKKLNGEFTDETPTDIIQYFDIIPL